jgi:hypothetical protein
MKIDKLDRTAFKYQTLDEAAHNLEYWQKRSFEERLEAANYLNSIAYNFDLNNPPLMDKSYFKIRTRK